MPPRRLEQRTRILPGDLRLAIGLLAGVGRRADVHVDAAFAVEGKPFVRVLRRSVKTFGDHFRRSGGQQLAGRQLVADDRVGRRVVDVAVAQRDAGHAAVAEVLALVELAVAVGVTQREHTAAGASASRLRRHEEIAVRRDSEMARASKIVRDDGRAETLRQLETAVIGIARRRCGRAGKRDQADDGNRRGNDED